MLLYHHGYHTHPIHHIYLIVYISVFFFIIIYDIFPSSCYLEITMYVYVIDYILIVLIHFTLCINFGVYIIYCINYVNYILYIIICTSADILAPSSSSSLSSSSSFSGELELSAVSLSLNDFSSLSFSCSST